MMPTGIIASLDQLRDSRGNQQDESQQYRKQPQIAARLQRDRRQGAKVKANAWAHLLNPRRLITERCLGFGHVRATREHQDAQRAARNPVGLLKVIEWVADDEVVLVIRIPRRGGVC